MGADNVAGCLWATDSRFLNDSLEIQYAGGQVAEDLRRRADEEDSSTSPRAEILNTASGMLSEPERWMRVYVACFCEQADLLSQWRAYGSDQGYAVGFDLDMLRDIVVPTVSERPQLARVLYGLEEAQSLISETLDNVGHSQSAHTGVEAHYEVMWQIGPMLAQIKHPAFREEREWRLVLVPEPGEPNLKFRASRIGATPYVELPFPQSAIKEIFIAPGEHALVRKSGLAELLLAKGHYQVPIRASESPLRV